MRRIAFGPFTLDLDSGDLQGPSGPVKLDAQPTKLLTLLVERAGTTVTRDEIEAALWSDDVIVDFDGSIRACIRKIRTAIGDSATSPRYVETQTGRGYRFLADVAVQRFRTESLPVVGRAPYRVALNEAFESARAGSGQLVFVAGEAGIGKTTIVEEFLERAASAGSTILRGWCSERLDGAEAYLPIVDALERLTRTSKNGISDRLKTLAPSWHAHVELSSRRIEGSSQRGMHREIAAFLESCSKHHPVVMFLDDLHWADAATFDLLSYLALRARTERFLLVLTYRTKEKEPPSFHNKLLDMKSRHLCQEIELAQLTENDIGDYVDQTFPQHAFPPTFPRVVHAQTAGSPLFMVELLRFLKERDVIVQEEGQWRVAGSVSDVQTGLPETLTSLIERKLGQLDPEQRDVLVAASVQGLEFQSAVVARAIGVEPAELEERLQRNERSFGLVRTVEETVLPDGTPTLVYRFVHIQYQNALYASLVLARRIQLSHAVAESLQGFYGERVAEIAADLALLFQEAHELGRAAEYFLMAARKAADVFAYTECVRLVRDGLSLVQQLPESERDPTELALQTLLAPALIATRGFGTDELAGTLQRTRELYESTGDVERVHATLFGLFAFHGFRGDHGLAGRVCQELWQSANRAGEEHVFTGYWARAVSFFLVGEMDVACSYYEKAVDAYDPAKHGPMSDVYAIDSGVGAYAYASWAWWYAGFPKRANVEIERALEVAAAKDPLSRVIVNGFAAHLDTLDNRFAVCETRAQAASELAEEYDLRPFAAWTTIHYGWAQVQRGNVEDGLERLADGLARFEATGSKLMKTGHLALFADACRAAEQPERGLKLIESAFQASSTGERFHVPELFRLRGELQRMLGDEADADASFLEALDVARRSNARSLALRAAVSRARLLVIRGREKEALSELSHDDFYLDDEKTADRARAQELLSGLADSPS